MQQRAEALESLRDTLAGLDGADEVTVRETAERAGAGLVGQDFTSALYLSQISQVLADQQARIEKLEAKPAQQTKARPRRSQKKSS
jgi:hypothetical protein